MKKIYYIISLCVLMLNSCDHLLELNPEDAVSNQTFFQTKTDFDQAITGMYSLLRPTNDAATNGAFAGNLYWSVCSDEGFYKFSWTNPWFDISRGELSPVTDNLSGIYGNLFKTIYWANSILDAMEQHKDQFDSDYYNYVLGQAHFVRAICYIRLTSLWGPVPMVDHIYTPAEAKLPRSSVHDITEQLIIPDLTIAEENLDEIPYGGKKGMATKQAAMGMKVRAYLYDKDYANTITAAQKLMDLARTSANVGFLDDYNAIFANNNEDNKEVLFALKYTAGGFKQGASFNTPFGSKLPGLSAESMNGSWSSFSITPELIDSYPLLDGKTEAEGSESVDETDKWANRGTRFETTFYIAGHSVLSNGQQFTKDYVCNISAKCGDDYPMTLDKGYMNEESKIEWNQEDESDFILLRYTDVMLMYAEAKTMSGNIDNSVYDILDQVRDRAGIAHIARGLSQNDMMTTIQNERKWEFAFEGIRYFDIRRWGIAQQVFDDITSDEKYDFGSHKIFKISNYLWPIPQDAIDANPNLLPNNSGY